MNQLPLSFDEQTVAAAVEQHAAAEQVEQIVVDAAPVTCAPPAEPSKWAGLGSKPHWSVSQINMYFDCAEFYRRWHIEKEKFPMGLAAIKGTGMHAAAEANFKHKMAEGVDLPVQLIVDAAVEAFDKRVVNEDVSLTSIEEGIGKAIVVSRARDDVRNLAAGFAIFFRKYIPKAVEKMVKIPVPRGSHDLLGVLDLVTVDDAVRDFKTSKRKMSKTSAAESIQLTMYSAGHMVAYGKPASSVGLSVLVSTTKGVSHQELVDTRDAKDYGVLAARINSMDQALKAGIFLPAALGHWKCSAVYCPFFTRGCPYVNAERVAAAKAAAEAEESD